MVKPRSSEAYEGDNVIIFCEVVGDPKPDVVWLRDFLNVSIFSFFIFRSFSQVTSAATAAGSKRLRSATFLSQLHSRRQQMWVAVVVVVVAALTSRCNIKYKKIIIQVQVRQRQKANYRTVS